MAGATDIEALRRIRRISPNIWILCPGVGAQGGDAKVTIINIIDYYHHVKGCLSGGSPRRWKWTTNISF